jgi:hypothetical protein
MTAQGFCIFAQHNKNTDYAKQAYALAMSIKIQMPNSKVCLITNANINKSISKVFDHVLDIPGNDEAADQDWKIQNRYKIYQCTPFERSIILDADMLVLSDISHWWKFLQNYHMYFTSTVKNYRDEYVSSDFYRKTFVENDLPNLYCGVHYYHRCRENFKFLDLLTNIVRNHNIFYSKFTPKNQQTWCSMDVSVSLASKILNLTSKITSTNSFITFTHMKPHLQNWSTVPNNWMEKVNVYFDSSMQIKIDNFRQQGVLHYVENEFLTDDLLKIIEKKYFERIE